MRADSQRQSTRMMRFFMLSLFAIWIFWLGLGVVVFLELGPRRIEAHAEGVLRRIPFWVNYEEEASR